MEIGTYGNRTKIRSESELCIPLLEKKEETESKKKKKIKNIIIMKIMKVGTGKGLLRV